MRYFGGKSAIAKWIAKYINNLSPTTYHEPFCGSCWVGELVKAKYRVLSDLNKPLITMWECLQNGWEPPSYLGEKEYQTLRDIQDPNDPLTAFAGFGCSFAGKYFGGYARSGTKVYSVGSKNVLLGRIKNFRDVAFFHMDYRESIPYVNGDVVYLDPPYNQTTKFYGIGEFDTDLFWDVAIVESYKRIVLVSEYSSPPDFVPILSIPTKTSIRGSDGKVLNTTEHLYVHYSNIDRVKSAQLTLNP